ncbi:MAG: hypothetical protein E7Z69_08370 [Thermoplasmata archaeon]|jgi:hypothetical protein|nr:hypothetical protein [Thermoplasmata archaeon]
MGYAAYNAVPIGRYRDFCGLSTVCLGTHGYSGGIRLEYLHRDGSVTETCTEIGDDGIDVDILDADLLRITK